MDQAQVQATWAAKYEAPEGKIWLCHACGKTSPNRVNGPNGWDEACFLNSTLIDKENSPA